MQVKRKNVGHNTVVGDSLRRASQDFERAELRETERTWNWSPPETFLPPPVWAPVAFWLGVVCMIVFDVLFLSSFSSRSQPPALSAVFLGASFALIGLYFALDPVRVDRVAPFGHGGDPRRIWWLGRVFVVAGTVIAFGAAVAIVL